MVFSFQNSTLTIEEFHSKLQEATNFPLRPFVIPFLKVTANPAPSHRGLPQEPGVHSLPGLTRQQAEPTWDPRGTALTSQDRFLLVKASN